MEFNRNHYFMIGLVVLLLGIQLRLVETYVLNEKCSDALAKRANKAKDSQPNPVPLLATATGTVPRQRITPPKWIGWALLSVGGVLILQSFAMKKPGG